MKKFLSNLFNKSIVKIIFVIYGLLSIVTLVVFADSLLRKDFNSEGNKLYLDGKWDVTINTTLYEGVDLDTFKFPSVDKGDSIMMEYKLPDDWDYENPALTFHVRHSTVKMYNEWQCFYKYGHERLAANKTVGSGIQIVNFSNEYKGSTLRILLTVSENNAFSRFDQMYISEWTDAQRILLTENRLALFAGSFLVVLGVVVATITVIATVFSKKYANLVWLSAFSILMGFWTLCYHNIVIIFSIPTYSTSLLEYMSIMLAPIPLLAYLHSYVDNLKSKIITTLYRALFIIQFLLSVTTIALHTADIVHSAASLSYALIVFFIEAIFFIFVFFKNSKKGSSMKKLHAFGVLVILICLIYDFLIYLFNRYTGMRLTQIKGISSLGIIVFIGILVIDLVHNISYLLMEEKDKERLIKSAYTDALTHINNRTYCTEYMAALGEKKSNNYTIINFDLNKLKEINDTYGHAQGDHLIKMAAHVISKAFSTSGVVGRMGGDEFIALIPTTDTNIIEQLIKNLNKYIAVANDDDPHLHLSLSLGYACNTEIDDDTPEKVYELADKRMYNNKRSFKRR